MKINWKKLLLCLSVPLAVGGLSALISGGMDSYDTLRQPPLSPPDWVFPVVWSVLFLLMGYASYRIWLSPADPGQKPKALTLYGIQLFLNFLWSPVFFRLEWRLAALFVLIALWLSVYLTFRAFTEIEERAGDLLLPYLLWVTFAGYLNFGAWLLNK